MARASAARGCLLLVALLLCRLRSSAFVAADVCEGRCDAGRGRRELLGSLGTVAAGGLQPARAVGGDTVVLNNGLSFPKAKS